MPQYVFPKWSNRMLPMLGVAALVVPLYVVYIVAFGFSPRTIDVGYMPHQPVPYSHELHAGKLGIDCRYCHNTVEETAKASIPPTQTCMNCHTMIHKDSPKLVALRESFQTGNPVLWTRVHNLPDYVYFNHSAHVSRGVSCYECHGRIDRMEVVYQHERLSMGWCLECHRDPDSHLRNPKDVTNLAWSLNKPEAELVKLGGEWRERNNLNPSQDCSTCHR